MSSKFGILDERIIGSLNYYVPDGSNIGTDLAPVLTSRTAKPADDADWLDYFIGRMSKAGYDPTKADRTRTGFSQTAKRYITDKQSYVQQDAMNVTLMEYPANLYDRIMYGLGAPIVADTAQQIFATSLREDNGWWRCIRYFDGTAGLVLCQFDVHVRATIQTAPDDSEDIGTPVLRFAHLGDAPVDLETIVFNPAP